MGMGGNRNYFSRINGNWNIVLRFPKAGYENGNEVMGMGGNGFTKVIPAHLYPGHAPPDISPARTITPPFLHGVGHSPLPLPPSANLQYKAI